MASTVSIICLRLSVSTFCEIPSISLCSSLKRQGRSFKLRMIRSFHFPPIRDTVVATGQIGSSSFVFLLEQVFHLSIHTKIMKKYMELLLVREKLLLMMKKSILPLEIGLGFLQQVSVSSLLQKIPNSLISVFR